MKLRSKFQKNISIFKVPVNFENSKTRHAIDMCPSVTFFFLFGLRNIKSRSGKVSISKFEKNA